jgi:hypothetical protein
VARPIDPEMIAHNDGWDEGYRVGLTDGRGLGKVDAALALSEAGLHDGSCPEPRRRCTCGLDAAIQALPSGMLPVPLNGLRKWRERVLRANGLEGEQG